MSINKEFLAMSYALMAMSQGAQPASSSRQSSAAGGAGATSYLAQGTSAAFPTFSYGLPTSQQMAYAGSNGQFSNPLQGLQQVAPSPMPMPSAPVAPPAPTTPTGVQLPNPLPAYNSQLPAGVGGFVGGQTYGAATPVGQNPNVPPQVFYQGNQAFMNVYPLIGTPGNYTGSTITTATQLGQLTAGEENYAHFVGLVMGYDTLPRIDYNNGPAIAPPVFNKGYFS